jgi:hypothetical protein
VVGGYGGWGGQPGAGGSGGEGVSGGGAGGQGQGGAFGGAGSGGKGGSAFGGAGSGGKGGGGKGGSAFGGAGSGGKGGAGGAAGQSTGGTAGDGAGGQSGGGASGSGGSGGETIAPTFETLKFVVSGTTPQCFASDCHDVGSHNPLKIDTRDPDMHMKLLTHVSEACGCMPVVKPGDPDGSALIKILKGPCGDLPRMPYDCDTTGGCVPDNYIEAIAEWIRSGAAPY